MDIERFNPTPSITALDRIDWVRDPVPPWLRNVLDRDQLLEIGRIEIELKTSVLRAQLVALEQTAKAIAVSKTRG